MTKGGYKMIKTFLNIIFFILIFQNSNILAKDAPHAFDENNNNYYMKKQEPYNGYEEVKKYFEEKNRIKHINNGNINNGNFAYNSFNTRNQNAYNYAQNNNFFNIPDMRTNFIDNRSIFFNNTYSYYFPIYNNYWVDLDNRMTTNYYMNLHVEPEDSFSFMTFLGSVLTFGLFSLF
jgi:hypothetical protein